jgi:hypothetical protein
MRDRWYRSGGTKNPYDPQIGAAAAAQAQLAQQSEKFNEDYFNKYVTPAMDELIRSNKVNEERQGGLYDLQMSEAKLQDQRYRDLGIPAEDKYYQMVKDYSAPEEQERQARGALGDLRTAEAGQAQQTSRRLSSLGIDPSSPAALSAQSDMQFNNAAAEAAAQTRAREAAKATGMQLTSDAANFGRGGQSGILQFGAGAGGASSAATSGAATAAQVAPGGAANVNAGFGLAQKAYGSNLDAYSELGKQSISSYQSPLQGIGQLAGQLGGAAIAHYGLPGSDRRMKKHTEKIVTLAHDIGLWAFRYIWEPVTAPLRYGFMADEVEKVFPDAVVVGPGGYKFVDYGKVPI